MARRLPGVWCAKSTTTKLVPSIVITMPRRMSVALIIMAVRVTPGKRRGYLGSLRPRRVVRSAVTPSFTIAKLHEDWPDDQGTYLECKTQSVRARFLQRAETRRPPPSLRAPE